MAVQFLRSILLREITTVKPMKEKTVDFDMDLFKVWYIKHEYNIHV